MRKDMGKCVIERPRSNSSAPSAKVRDYGRITLDAEGYDYDGLTRLPVSQKQEGYHKKLGSKSFTDVLGPIHGYLMSCVGRPWNDVFSEISQTLGRAPWPVRHIITDHLNVAVKTYRGADGHVWHCDRHGTSRVTTKYYNHAVFYVEPETGILKATWPTTRKPYPSAAEMQKVDADNGHAYVQINGLWFLGKYVEVDGIVFEYVNRRGQKRSIFREPTWPHYGTTWSNERVLRFEKIKSCNRREIRELLQRRDAYLARKYPLLTRGIMK